MAQSVCRGEIFAISICASPMVMSSEYLARRKNPTAKDVFIKAPTENGRESRRASGNVAVIAVSEALNDDR